MSAQPTSNVLDVDQADFATEVVERSHEQPVVVDFWAAWCGPCRTLGPMLEQAVSARGGDVRLVKVDVDRNQAIAQQYRVQGIPAVKGFRDGEVVAEFVGAVGAPQVEAFLDELVPSEADRLASSARGLADRDPEQAAAHYRRALDLDPSHRAAAIGLAELVVGEDPDEALALIRAHRPHPGAEAVAARAELAVSGIGDEQALRRRVADDPDDGEARLLLGRLLAANGDHEAAAEQLLAAVRAGGETREAAREHLVSMFTALGDGHDLVRRTRPLLARALF